MKALLMAALALLALPVLAAANTGGAAANTAAALCKAQRTAMTVSTFKLAYGTNDDRSNAFGKCVSRMTRAHEQAQSNAVDECRAEQDDGQFAAAHGGKTFTQFYGTGHSGRNAFGKCVSAKTKQELAERQKTIINAAKACRAERNDAGFAASHGGKTFAQFYGKNDSQANAFGKCVSMKAQAKNS